MIRKNGDLKPASWHEALDHAARRLAVLSASPARVGVLGSARATNEENYLAAKLARTALRTGNIDFCLRKAYHSLWAGICDVCGELPPLALLDAVEKSDLVLLMEGDLARTHPRAACAVMKALSGGAKLVTLGAVKTQMSRLASLHFMMSPGQEGEVINNLLAAALVSNHETRAKCEGLGPLRQRLAAVEPSTQAREAMTWITAAERAVYLLTPTCGPPEKARLDAAALASLAAVTGHLVRAGCGLLPLVPRCNWQGALEMGVAPDHVIPGKPSDAAPGLDAETMMRKIKGLVITATNPLASLAAGKRLLPLLRSMECVVVLDAFWTASVQAADVVLPIAAPTESAGTYISMEGRVQSLCPAVEPPGLALPGWRVLAELCTKLGCETSYRSANEVLLEIASLESHSAQSAVAHIEQGWRKGPLTTENGWPRVRATDTRSFITDEYPWILARNESIDWGSDPLIHYSPTLSRDFISKRKLFPDGLLEMSRRDADELGVRQGTKVRLLTAYGIVEIPVVIRTDLSPGVLFIPYAFREYAFDAMEEADLVAARVERI